MNNQEIIKFEFLLTLEKNIVCQRFFNVKNFNQDSLKSLDVYDYLKIICDEIVEDLKIKNYDYLNDNQEYILNSRDVESGLNDQKENFILELKIGDRVFIQRTFPAHYFHPKVRYTVDIRPSLKGYLLDLTNILSSDELETTYLNYKL